MSPRSRNVLFDLALLALCAIAFGHGVRITSDLDWPHDPDLFRDMAQAQVFADRGGLADPFYRDERAWYNPLVPALVAGSSRLLDVPVRVMETRLGAYYNLLGPILLYVLLAAFVGRGAALAGVFAFLFLADRPLSARVSASYSPWLFVSVAVQPLFCATLVAYRKAVETDSLLRDVAAGAWLGLTFLGHAAPALLLCGIVGGETGRSLLVEGSDKRRSLARACVVALVALALGAPFLASIVGHYHLRVRNPVPVEWLWPSLHLDNLPAFLRAYVSVRTAGAAVGLVVLARLGGVAGRLLRLWLLLAAALFAYSVVETALRGRGWNLPALLPGIHFFFYLTLMESVLFGIGAAALWRAAADRVPGSPAAEAAVAAVFTLAACFWFLRSYDAGRDFLPARAEALHPPLSERTAVFDWLRGHTRPGDVFLASDALALGLVGPAGRKVVALDRVWSNPYVDWDERDNNRKLLWRWLRLGAAGRFTDLARSYGVTHVITEEPALDGAAASSPALRREFTAGHLSVYRLLTDGS